MSSSVFQPFSDLRRRRRIGDRAVAAGCLLWLVLSGWMFFREVPPGLLDNHTSPTMQQRMRVCEGTFRERFECKQALLLTGGRWGFAVAANRLTLMCAPAVTAWVVWSILRRRME